MDYKAIINKVNNGDYNSKLTYPPYRKDETKRAMMKDKDLAQRKAYQVDEAGLEGMFMCDLRKYIESELDKELTDKQFFAIWDKVYEDRHSGGYSEILIEASNLTDLVKTLLGDK